MSQGMMYLLHTACWMTLFLLCINTSIYCFQLKATDNLFMDIDWITTFNFSLEHSLLFGWYDVHFSYLKFCEGTACILVPFPLVVGTTQPSSSFCYETHCMPLVSACYRDCSNDSPTRLLLLEPVWLKHFPLPELCCAKMCGAALSKPEQGQACVTTIVAHSSLNPCPH